MHIQESTLRHLRWPSSLSREENVLHASVNQLLHSYPLQEENIPLYTVPNPIGICRQQTKFATFTLSLQRGKRFACFPSRQHTRINFPPDKLLWQSADNQMIQTIRPEAFAASFQTKRTQNICILSFSEVFASSIYAKK